MKITDEKEQAAVPFFVVSEKQLRGVEKMFIML